LAICSLKRRIFEDTLAPVYFSSSRKIGLQGREGCSDQISSTKFSLTGTSVTSRFAFSNKEVRFCDSAKDTMAASIPTLEPRATSCTVQLIFHMRRGRHTVDNHLDHVGVSGNPAFINVHPGPSSFPACRKYRPSVQHLASSRVITARPAEPVKPVMYSLLASQGARYSDESVCRQPLLPTYVGHSRASSEGTTLIVSFLSYHHTRNLLCLQVVLLHELS
jgi:hypothetical protein